jgi:nicotinate-nucleotide--dimethylbenzimidazole phosphoribosyltransferase
MNIDESFDAQVRALIDGKTKPLGALGRIEGLAAQIARITHTLRPRMNSCALYIFVADHGIAAEGVSAYPQAVTRQMALNFLGGGAAASVFARVVGASVQVVDAGIAGAPLAHPQLIDRRLGPGTDNFASGPAMSDAQVEQALRHGCALAQEDTSNAMALGEMGIANTSAAALIAHKITGASLDVLIGRGAGLDDAGLAKKRALLAKAAARTPARLTARDALSVYGGFEVAMMAGAMIGAAEARKPVLVDGYIAAAAALAACQIAPEARTALIFAHRSAERGHDVMLEALGAQPLLDLDLRLGEGTGALLAWPLVRAAAAMLCDMASFEGAGVSGPSRA